LVEIKDLLMAICLCHRHGRMECWNTGILRVRAEINNLNCQKLLSFNFVQDKLTHHSIIPLLHYSNCERSELTYMLMDEDDLTTMKIEIYLTWQQPNNIFNRS